MRPTSFGLLIAAALSSGACHTMTPVTLADVDAFRPARLWVTKGDQSHVVVEAPRESRNRLVGFVDGNYVMLPADELKQILMRRPAPGRTGALVAAGLVGTAALVYAISGGGGYQNPCDFASSDCEANAPNDTP